MFTKLIFITIVAFLAQKSYGQIFGNNQNFGNGISNPGFSNFGSNSGCNTMTNSGVGEVSVTGEVPVKGNTCIQGNVPVVGYVTFEGEIPAAGSVSVAQNNCDCNKR